MYITSYRGGSKECSARFCTKLRRLLCSYVCTWYRRSTQRCMSIAVVIAYLITNHFIHSQNIMCTKSGHLFRTFFRVYESRACIKWAFLTSDIDFGRFLGNAEKFAGVSRDRAPFVFTPEFAYAMGGVGSSEYNYFVTLCCAGYNVLRKHANIFINLFAMVCILKPFHVYHNIFSDLR